jgi:hypothetical protein
MAPEFNPNSAMAGISSLEISIFLLPLISFEIFIEIQTIG